MRVTTEEVSLLAVAASLTVPLLTETVKRRFGREQGREEAGHVRHEEIMAELNSCRAALAACEKAAREARTGEEAARAAKEAALARCHEADCREIVLLREQSGMQHLIAELVEGLPARAGRKPGTQAEQDIAEQDTGGKGGAGP